MLTYFMQNHIMRNFFWWNWSCFHFRLEAMQFYKQAWREGSRLCMSGAWHLSKMYLLLIYLPPLWIVTV